MVDRVAYICTFAGDVVALDADDGRLRWQRNLESPIYASAAVHDGSLYVGAMDGRFHALDLENGRVRWSITTPAALRSSAVVAPAPHMLVRDPPIVSTFDQVGIASLSTDLVITSYRPETGIISAWGWLHFGGTQSHPVGVPRARTLIWALGGRFRDGYYVLEAHHPWFEITAFPVPLDRLRLRGWWPVRAEALGELDAELTLMAASTVLTDSIRGRPPRTLRMIERVWDNAAIPSLTPDFFRGTVDQWRTSGELIARTLVAAYKLWTHKNRSSWGLLDERN